MRPLCLSLLLLCLCGMGRSQKKNDVDVAEMKAHRLESTLAVDGTLKVNSSKPLKGIVLYFDFLSADKEVLATEKALVTEETVKAGQDQPFHVESRFPVGSVRFKVRAFDGSDRELRLGNPGPFIIE